MKGELYIHRNIRTQDFTHGKLQKRLEEIQKTKEIHFLKNSMPGTGSKIKAVLPQWKNNEIVTENKNDIHQSSHSG